MYIYICMHVYVCILAKRILFSIVCIDIQSLVCQYIYVHCHHPLTLHVASQCTNLLYMHINIRICIHIYMCIYKYIYMCIPIYIYVEEVMKNNVFEHPKTLLDLSYIATRPIKAGSCVCICACILGYVCMYVCGYVSI